MSLGLTTALMLMAHLEEIEMSEWRTIETGPTDGTPVWGITMEAQNPSPRIMWFQGDRWVRVAKAEKFVPSGPHAWWPTHWQKITEPSDAQ